MREFLGENEFKVLYFKYHPILFRVASYVLKDEVLAEDIVQECFLKVWNNRSGFLNIENRKAYLISMTRNAAFDQLKKTKKINDLVLSLHMDESENHVELSDDNFKKALEEAVSKLTPKCRLVFSLSRFEGLSNDEIADYLDISKRTVETQISLALKAFRGELKPIFEHWLPGLSSGVLAFIIQHL